MCSLCFPLFLVVSCTCIIPSSCRFVNPYRGQFRNFLRLDVTVGSCPSEHSTPPCRGDTLWASGAVADVVGEASDGHCCFLCMLPLYLYYRHKSMPIVSYSRIISKYLGRSFQDWIESYIESMSHKSLLSKELHRAARLCAMFCQGYSLAKPKLPQIRPCPIFATWSYCKAIAPWLPLLLSY